jgi:hypothetical protein
LKGRKEERKEGRINDKEGKGRQKKARRKC